MADLNLIPENCQRCEDEESITAKAVIPPHPASSYVETYVGRAVPTGQYRIDRPSGPLTSLYDKGGRLDIANYCTVSLFLTALPIAIEGNSYVIRRFQGIRP